MSLAVARLMEEDPFSWVDASCETRALPCGETDIIVEEGRRTLTHNQLGIEVRYYHDGRIALDGMMCGPVDRYRLRRALRRRYESMVEKHLAKKQNALAAVADDDVGAEIAGFLKEPVDDEGVWLELERRSEIQGANSPPESLSSKL